MDRVEADKEKMFCVAGQCDLFEGEWQHDPEGPLYTNSTCFYIQEAQNCMSNGRHDTEYMYWRWKPRDCDLPRFDAKSFLDSFRGKAIGFIGDSIARNQMQSLLCLLSQVWMSLLLSRMLKSGVLSPNAEVRPLESLCMGWDGSDLKVDAYLNVASRRWSFYDLSIGLGGTSEACYAFCHRDSLLLNSIIRPRFIRDDEVAHFRFNLRTPKICWRKL